MHAVFFLFFFLLFPVSLHARDLPECRLPRAPEIIVSPHTEPVKYDYSKTSTELNALTSKLSGAHAGPKADSTTGGLRHDTPKVEMSVQWGALEYPRLDLACLWYNKVEVNISLSPVIYVAKDFPKGRCRKEILIHEQKHVKVDRLVFNAYAKSIGQAVKKVVNETGPLGPFPKNQLDAAQAQLVGKIGVAIQDRQAKLEAVMDKRQAQIDTPEEYARISKICNKSRSRR